MVGKGEARLQVATSVHGVGGAGGGLSTLLVTLEQPV